MKKYVLFAIFISTWLFLISCTTTGTAYDSYSRLGGPFLKSYLLTLDSPATEDISPWKVWESEDEFGNPVSKFIMGTTVSGVFSNSATRRDNLEVLIYGREESIDYVLYEYGQYRAVPYSPRVTANINNTSVVLNDAGAYGISRKSAIQVAEELAKGNDVDIYIIDSESSYRFTIPAKGYISAYKKCYFVEEVTENDVMLGHLSFSFTLQHPLFWGNTRERVVKKALRIAHKQYGPDIELKNLRYEGSWTSGSLFYYFSMFGWMERLNVTADVIAK